MKKKKPDQVVDAPGIMPYTTNVGAPAIQHENIDAWKQRGVAKVNHELETKFNELKAEYQRLVKEFKWNELVYNAKFSFEPVIGETYYLYNDKRGDIFLSLIAPTEWNKVCVGAFKLDSNQKWIKHEKETNI